MATINTAGRLGKLRIGSPDEVSCAVRSLVGFLIALNIHTHPWGAVDKTQYTVGIEQLMIRPTSLLQRVASRTVFSHRIQVLAVTDFTDRFLGNFIPDGKVQGIGPPNLLNQCWCI